MSRTFEHFPEDIMCPICGTPEDKECALVPIDGTNEDKICQAAPVHVACFHGALFASRFNREIKTIYFRAEAPTNPE